MVTVTHTALETLENYVREKRVAPYVRIEMVTLGSHWKSLALCLDRSRASDQAYSYGSLTFIISRSLLLRCGTITVDYQEPEDAFNGDLQHRGFSIVAARPLTELNQAPADDSGNRMLIN